MFLLEKYDRDKGQWKYLCICVQDFKKITKMKESKQKIALMEYQR